MSDSLALLQSVSESLMPGKPPSFIDIHVYKALELLFERSMGRAILGRSLGLGEGVARTMIKHLRNAGIIKVSRGGIVLTAGGRDILTHLRKNISEGFEVPKGKHAVGTHNYVVLVTNAVDHVKQGIEQRDAALIVGARGATTLLFDGIQFNMPGMDTEIEPEVGKILFTHLRPRAGDVVVIGSADDPYMAEMGAKAAALDLLEKSMAP